MPQILVVCTGNICRSPMAVGFLRAALARRLGPEAPTVVSAGLVARHGNPAEPEAVQAASERGTDISHHAATRLSVNAIERADLVLGMATEHRERITKAVPAAAAKTFTLKELVRLLEALPAASTQDQPSSVLARRIAEADVLRSDRRRPSPLEEDVRDPLGLSVHSFRSVAAEIDVLCSALVDGLFGGTSRWSAVGGEGV